MATIPNSGVGLESLTVDDTHTYYIQYNFSPTPRTYEVKRVPKSGGMPQTLYLSPGNRCWDAGDLEVDDNDLYWLEDMCDEPNIIRKMTKDGSTSPTTLYSASSTRVINTLALRSNLIFFTESEFPRSVLETTGKIRYMAKTGGTISDLVTDLTNPFSLVIDSRYVYWSDTNGRVGGTSGTKRENLPPLDNDGDGFDQTVDCDDNDPTVTVGNTCPSDSEVTVEDDSGEVSVTFPEVTGGGTTTITVRECTPEDVEGITLAPTAPLCADITTDATFEGQAKVCITYDDTGLTLVQEANLSMVRCDDAAACELLACDPPEPVDTVNNIVCGCTDGFSTFALGTALDSDGDFVPDLLDNCPHEPNIFQEDEDQDEVGDVCDNCPSVANPDQSDSDQDGIGDACEEGATCKGIPATLVGTNNHDILQGTPGDDVIVGRAGNDTIQGFGGNDLICGNAGNDRISGGEATMNSSAVRVMTSSTVAEAQTSSMVVQVMTCYGVEEATIRSKAVEAMMIFAEAGVGMISAVAALGEAIQLVVARGSQGCLNRLSAVNTTG